MVQENSTIRNLSPHSLIPIPLLPEKTNHPGKMLDLHLRSIEAGLKDSSKTMIFKRILWMPTHHMLAIKIQMKNKKISNKNRKKKDL